jgi:arginyl-tRNA synthetase
VKEVISAQIEHILKETYGVAPKGELLSRTPHADYASGVSLMHAKELGKNPKELAEDLKTELLHNPHLKGIVADISIAGPGFLNFVLTQEALVRSLSETREAIEEGTSVREDERINIEFISANPTGDLHIGHGRSAFYGDMLARILEHAGARVSREYYINDSRESNQIIELGKTALEKGEQYKTERLEAFIKEMDFSGMNESEAGAALAEKVQDYNKNFIEQKLGIHFDTWYSEDKEIRAQDKSAKALALLTEKGLVYEKEGAVWLKTSEYGDDEDRVLIRSDKTATYFLADIAYHIEKFARGNNTVIDLLGADHHGHVKRMHAVGKMLGWPQHPPQPVMFVVQLVGLKEGEERKKMSKRAGTVILLEDLVDEYGIDVVRWFFAEKALTTHMDFDADLARDRSAKNPVFYVQYAHARICSIAKQAAALAGDNSTVSDFLQTPSARVLAFKISEFSEVVNDIASDYHVHKLTTYAYELAYAFSQFYRDVRVIEGETYHTGALELTDVARDTLAKTLGLLGISAPENM